MSKFKSRKFIVSVITGLVLVANDGLGMNLNLETILSLAGICMTYVYGQSKVDQRGK